MAARRPMVLGSDGHPQQMQPADSLDGVSAAGVKGTTAGTPGTGAFTPNAAAPGHLAWSTVPAGWIGLVRFDDGGTWELSWCYWNGTTLSRSASQLYRSSTGSILTLTAAATAMMAVDGARAMRTMLLPQRGWFPVPGATTITALGVPAMTVAGTAASAAVAATNRLTEMPRSQTASATTVNAQAGYSTTTIMAVASSTAGRGGWEFAVRFGAAVLPTGPRLFVGLTGTTFVGNTGEPSALVANCAVFALDSTDSTIQLLTNSNSGGGTRINTGIALAAGGLYEAVIWSDPGTLTVDALLIRIDTGEIFYTETSTDVPVAGATLFPQVLGGLNGTNSGTAFTMNMGGLQIRSGGW